LDGPSGLAPDGVHRPSGGPVELVVDHQLAGASPLPAVTVRASPIASEALWSAGDDEVAAQLLAGAGLDGVGLGAGVVAGTVQVHRWKYARVAEPVGAACLVAMSAPRLVLAGDAFCGVSGVDGRDSEVGIAYRSGLAAVAALG
ncbi:MAG: hypothetical protein ACK4V6_20595, partial [Microthrixaceae bacterium]